MKFLKMFCFMVLGALVMVGTLTWISQFFTGEREVSPLIWLDTNREEEEPETPWWRD